MLFSGFSSPLMSSLLRKKKCEAPKNEHNQPHIVNVNIIQRQNINKTMLFSYMVWSGWLQPPSQHCPHTSPVSTAQRQWYLLPGSGYEWQQDVRQCSDPEQDGTAVITRKVTCSDNWYMLVVFVRCQKKQNGRHICCSMISMLQSRGIK